MTHKFGARIDFVAAANGRWGTGRTMKIARKNYRANAPGRAPTPEFVAVCWVPETEEQAECEYGCYVNDFGAVCAPGEIIAISEVE